MTGRDATDGQAGLRILGLWRGRAGWLIAGVVISLAALVAGVALMAMGGALLATAIVAGVLITPVALRAMASARRSLKQ